jgi:hypothetical protein
MGFIAAIATQTIWFNSMSRRLPATTFSPALDHAGNLFSHARLASKPFRARASQALHVKIPPAQRIAPPAAAVSIKARSRDANADARAVRPDHAVAAREQ